MFAVPSIRFYFMSIDEQIAQFGAPRKLIVDTIEKSGGACAFIVNEAVREANMKSSGYLLYRITDMLVDYCLPIANKIMQNLETAEEEIFDTIDA